MSQKNPSSLQYVLDTFRNESEDPVDLGRRFERLIKRYFEESPEYSSVVDTVWMWSEFPLRHQISPNDTGIDLVVLTRSKEYWAVQCKLYGEDSKVSKDDYDTFIEAATSAFEVDGKETRFAHAVMVSTTGNEGRNADGNAERMPYRHHAPVP